MIWLMMNTSEDSYFLKDYYTDEEFRTHDKAGIIREWRK
jgi:hypothetical protein